MNETKPKSEFPEHSTENRRIWDANAVWWDDQIGDGNEFQTLLIEPATERLLAIRTGDIILDIACGAGRFARRMAELGARVVAVDYSAEFIDRARIRTSRELPVEYHLIDATDTSALVALGTHQFDKAVCTMALMDMPEIKPALRSLALMLKPSGAFVFSVTHPCFHSATIQRFAEMYEEDSGRHIIRNGVKISSYLKPTARKTEGILGQPEPHYFFHRPISVLLQCCFESGFVLDRIEEHSLPSPAERKPGVRWSDMPDIPPILVVRAWLKS
jgi:2-polyprenyl-3-methyl-5-hydroxy-6-metoxy-1,4-benzoquinol methylase